MATLVLIGWLVYPLGYLQSLLGFPTDLRELIYNIADLINKVGLAAIIFWGGRLALNDLSRPEIADGRGTRTAADSLAARSATDSLLSGPS
jgi:hypothetical protein